MLHVITAIRDSASATFGKPVFTPTRAVAVRALAAEVNDGAESLLRSNPSDFELFELGTYDDATCVMELHE